VKRDLERAPEAVNLGDEAYLRKGLDRMPDVGRKFEYFLNTGNLVSKSGLDLSQSTGFTARRVLFAGLSLAWGGPGAPPPPVACFSCTAR